MYTYRDRERDREGERQRERRTVTHKILHNFLAPCSLLPFIILVGSNTNTASGLISVSATASSYFGSRTQLMEFTQTEINVQRPSAALLGQGREPCIHRER